MSVLRRPRTLLAALGTAALAASTVLAAPGQVGAAPVLRLGGAVDLGCANPANHLAARLLPAARGTAGHQLTCFGKVRAAAGQNGPAVTQGPVGLTPADVQSAYRLRGLSAAGRTVAVVDAYDDPQAESDLAVYRKTFGLPACTTANGCFRKVDQAGASAPLPAGDYGWGTEISLDLDAVSAACPTCRILLVEANSASSDDLGIAVNTAARLGARAISNSYGGAEDSTVRSYDKYYNHPGVAVTASTGDDGYGVEYPASSPSVTAVGGTTLTKAATARGWTESAWSGAGSGCSAYEPKPSWQHDTGCARRTVGDVSADADPNSGLAVYDTYNNCGSTTLCDQLLGLGLAQGLDGWAQVGGTSLSSPLVAAVATLHGGSYSPSLPYSHRSSLFDVTSGSNGSCGGGYLCTGRPGYDGPTGLGTPNGTGAF